MCRFGRHYNKEERERTMARGKKRKIFDKGKKVCTPLGCIITKKE